MAAKWMVRDAVKDDIARVHELVVELAVYEKEPDAVVETVEGMKAAFADGVFKCVVAEEEEMVVGFALFYGRYSTWEGRCTYLEDLYVTQRCRGKGIGKALFLEVARRSARLNDARLQWQVLNWNQSAIDFYKSVDAILDPTWVNGKLDRTRLQRLL